MNPAQESALTQAEGALGLLKGQERSDAEELIAFGRRLFDAEKTSVEETARIASLVEVLARRSSSAMPYAALGRALLAHLRGMHRDRDELIREFEAKMAMLGM